MLSSAANLFFHGSEQDRPPSLPKIMLGYSNQHELLHSFDADRDGDWYALWYELYQAVIGQGENISHAFYLLQKLKEERPQFMIHASFWRIWEMMDGLHLTQDRWIQLEDLPYQMKALPYRDYTSDRLRASKCLQV